MLVSGGDDCTVKVWTIDPSTVLTTKLVIAAQLTAHAYHVYSRNNSLPELEPTITLRGHTAPVTAVCVSSSRRLIFSASLDSTVRLWSLPHGNHDPYAPHDESVVLSELIGHTDAVWDVCLLPPMSDTRDDQETVLVSIGAEGSIKVWEANTATPSKWQLRSSFDYHGDVDRSTASSPLPIPTCLAVYQPDFTKILVGFSNSVVRAFDVRTGAVSITFTSEDGGEFLHLSFREQPDVSQRTGRKRHR